MQISEEFILESKPGDSDIASCELCAKWDRSGDTTVQDLNHRIEVKGVDIDSFLITISPKSLLGNLIIIFMCVCVCMCADVCVCMRVHAIMHSIIISTVHNY